ncbi:YSIRK-type signal peptide-containing protein [Streptococcus suis]
MFKDQSKKMIKKQEYFSLRKFKRGLASVTVGATLFRQVQRWNLSLHRK